MENITFNDNFLTSIPPLFNSSLTNEPHETCCVCEQNLLENNTLYSVEKAIGIDQNTQKQTTVFDYAICFKCSDVLRSSLSKSSQEKFMNFFSDKGVSFEKRAMDMLNNSELRPEEWIDKCMITNKNVTELDSYQLYGFFQGNKMVFNGFPFMLSETVLEELSEGLSEETKGFFDDFVELYLPVDFHGALIKRKLIFI